MRIRARTIVLSVLTLLALALVAAITAVGWQVVLGPKMRPLTGRTFASSDARLVRGKYLVEGVAGCFHCHSDHDLTDPELTTPPSMKGAGWQIPIPELGTVIAPNITPDPETGIGAWTDDEIARAMQEGVDKNGRALFPVMPYPNFRHLTDEDLASIIVYLRSIPAIKHAVPATKLITPLNVLVKTMPVPLTAPDPLPQTTVPEKGAYLMTVAGCRDCHSTQDDRGNKLPGMDLAGGNLFHNPANMSEKVFSVNITMDPSGISHYDEDMFVETLQTGRLRGRLLSHIMPFEYFRNMTEDDMRAIFAYIQTVPKVVHRISNTDPPTKCPLDGRDHGLGALNVKAK